MVGVASPEAQASALALSLGYESNFNLLRSAESVFLA